MEQHPQQYYFSTMSDLVVALAQKIENILNERLKIQPHVSLVVSGGNTPRPLYEKLSQSNIDWSRVIITLTDERWVDVNDPNSNEWLVKNTLLINNASVAQFISLKTQDPTPEQAVPEIHGRLHTIPKPYDVMILGMGLDGHTASLFPCADNIAMALDKNYPYACIATHPKQAPFARMSLSLNELQNARNRILLLQGEEKWLIYQKAQEKLTLSSSMPIKNILAISQCTSVYITK